MSYIGKDVAPQPQGTYSQSEIDTQLEVKANLASPTFTGTVTATTFSGALSGNAVTATTASTATNLAGGSLGTIPYQSGSGTTVQLATGTSGYLLQCNGSSAPSWVTPPSSGITLAQAQAYDIGVNQTWQDVTASRVVGTTYTNSTGKPIMISVNVGNASTSTKGSFSVTVNGVQIANNYVSTEENGVWGNVRNTICAIVPNGHTYSFSVSSAYLNAFTELR